jgi:hypothetical protein
MLVTVRNATLIDPAVANDTFSSGVQRKLYIIYVYVCQRVWTHGPLPVGSSVTHAIGV